MGLKRHLRRKLIVPVRTALTDAGFRLFTFALKSTLKAKNGAAYNLFFHPEFSNGGMRKEDVMEVLRISRAFGFRKVPAAPRGEMLGAIERHAANNGFRFVKFYSVPRYGPLLEKNGYTKWPINGRAKQGLRT